MSRLITFSCSHTYGQGLSDCSVNTYDPGPTPSKFAWPQVLADKLNLECVNMSQPGTSPKRNWYSITNFDFNEDDIVIVKWPNPNRTCIIKEDKIEHLAPWDKSNNKLVKFYYKGVHDEFDSMVALNMYMSYTHLLLSSLNIKNYHCRVATIDIFDWNKANFLNVSMSDIRDKYPNAPDGHAGEEAHQEFARMLHKIMEKE